MIPALKASLVNKAPPEKPVQKDRKAQKGTRSPMMILHRTSLLFLLALKALKVIQARKDLKDLKETLESKALKEILDPLEK